MNRAVLGISAVFHAAGLDVVFAVVFAAFVAFQAGLASRVDVADGDAVADADVVGTGGGGAGFDDDTDSFLLASAVVRCGVRLEKRENEGREKGKGNSRVP